MPNKIDSTNPPFVQVNGKSGSTKTLGDAAATAGVHTAAGSAGTDTVDVTDSARSMVLLEEAVASAGVVDQGRVDALRAQIEAGSYTVTPQQVADKLLQMDRVLPVPK